MTSPTLLSLADRVSNLTTACRETDREILFAIFPKDRVAIFDGVKHISTMTGRDGEPWFLPLADRDDCPRYTDSLDAAMTLKAEDIDLDLSYSIILVDGKAWFAELTGGDPHQTGFWPQQGRGHNGACALTAAIFRARSALEASHG